MTKRKAAIVDIDGTISDARPRLHHLTDCDIMGSRVKDYDAFHSECHADAPIVPLRLLIQALADSGHQILLCTGRPEHYREMTEDWLGNHFIAWDELYMRRNDDHRKAPLVKREMLNFILGKGYHPFIAIEDQQEVVDMWRANGIHCLQTQVLE